MRERERSFRRGIAGGAVLGVAVGVVLALFEVTFVARSAWGYFDGAGELGRFALGALGVLAAGGAIAGAAGGLFAAAIARAAEAIGGRGDGRAVWQARLYTVAATAPVALGCAQIFRGPQAQKIPGHDLYAVAIGLVALAALKLAARRWLALAAALDERRVGARAAVALGAALVGAAWGVYVADQRVLPRLYPFFHRGLGALGAGLVALALGGIFLRLGPRRAAEPRAAMAIALAALIGGALALGGFARARGLRSLALERTAHLSRLLRAAPFAAAPSAAPDAHATAADPAVRLPDGPRLGDVDVFLITVDAMRADRLAPRTAPFMSALADSGTRFERAYAQVPHTSFSVATLLTGKHVYSLSALGLDASGHETLAEVLRRERYKTAAFYPPSVFFIDHDRLKALEDSRYGFEYVKYEYLPAQARTDQVIRFLESERPERAFVWVHYLEPHEPYEPHPGYSTASSTLLERYDGEVRLVDAEVARLVGWVRAHRPRALVVLAADHGEEFGEHGGQYHGTTLYEEQVRVPLAFVSTAPGGAGISSRVVRGPVGLVDVAPTILSLLAIPPSARMRGRDLGPWLSPEGAPDAALGPEFSEIDRKKMIALGADKLICDLESDSCQLYDLAADPGERRNRVDDAPRAEALRARLDAWMAAETRFERDGRAGDDGTRRALERGRLGDRAAVPQLGGLLASGDAATRAEAARLIARLPPDAQVKPALEPAARDPALDVARWAQVALARLGDGAARGQVAAWLRASCDAARTGTSAEIELCARAALAAGDVVEEGRVLDRLADELELDVALTRALGATRGAVDSGNPGNRDRALDALVEHLGPVRARGEVVAAIGELGLPRALDTLDRWIAGEPYLPVRASMARVIAKLALAPEAGARRAAAERTLAALAEREPEPPVLGALIESLAALGSPRVTDAAHARAPEPGELWLLAADGTVTRLPVARAGPVPVKSPPARLAYWRKPR